MFYNKINVVLVEFNFGLDLFNKILSLMQISAGVPFSIRLHKIVIIIKKPFLCVKPSLNSTYKKKSNFHCDNKKQLKTPPSHIFVSFSLDPIRLIRDAVLI